MIKKMYFILFLTLISTSVFAKGETEESDYKSVTGKENWEHEVPIEDMDPGEYNLLIRAKDKANNETFAGPYDIFVDPESDLPIVSITNPSSLLRVGGVLNIVGTARDDDGIKEVYIKLNDGDYFLAEGAEFWNYTLEPDVLKDGQHIITAKAVDINGLEGYETIVVYNQDTIKPVNTVENYENGAFFTGKVTINGKVIDANGINSLEVSRDNQESYESVKLHNEDDENFYTFEMDINTLDLEDGPNIYWFKSMDNTGSVGYSAFLFFVDNIGPAVTILDPKETDVLNGTITVTGKISDVIGIKNFKYIYGDEEGEIKLLAGNPFWSQKIDLLNVNKDSTTVLFISEDKSGNISEVEFKLPINNEADKPVLTLDQPKADIVYKDKLIIEGSILDDDIVKGIKYSIDGNEETELKTFGSFSIEVDSISSGEHTLEIRALDINNVPGDLIEIPFKLEKYEPKIMLTSLDKNGEEKLFHSGIELQNDKGYKLLGSVATGNNLTRLQYRLGAEDLKDIKWTKGADNSIAIFSIPVDTSFKYGVVNIDIEAEDNFGNVSNLYTQVYITNYTVITEEWGLLNISTKKGEDIPVTKSKPFEAYFNGPPIVDASIYPETDIVDVTYKGKVLTVIPKNVGRTDKVKILVETTKGFFETKDFSFIVDDVNPVLTLNLPAEGSEVSKVLSIAGTVEEFSLKSLEYRFSNQEEFSPIDWRGSGNQLIFKTNLQIPETESETLSIEIIAKDKLNNISSVIRSFTIKENKFIQELTKEEIENNTGKGSDKPILIVNFPVSNHVYFSNPIISGFTRDDDKVKEIVISDIGDNSKKKTVKADSLFNIDLKDFGPGKKTLNVIAKDINGTESKVTKISYIYVEKDSAIAIDTATEPGGKVDYQIGTLVSIEKGVLINGKILGYNSGNLEYKFGESDFKKANISDGSFSISVPESLEWGRNNLTIKFIDDFGRETLKSTFFYLVDKINTKGIVDKPGVYLKDNREKDEYVDLTSEPLAFNFVGRTIKSIELESKDGNVPDFLTTSFKDKMILVTSLKSGIAKNIKFNLTTIDGDIYSSDYYNYISDKQSPLLTISSENNSYINSSYVLTGELHDDLKVEKLSYSLNQGATWLELELKEPKATKEVEEYKSTSPLDNFTAKETNLTEFVFTDELDFSNSPDRGYSIWIKGEDLKGNISVKKISLIKDSTSPKLNLLTPGVDEVNGIISIIGEASDNIELEEVVFSKDGETFTKTQGIRDFSFFIDFGEDEVFPETFTIRAIDKAGNYKDIFPKFNINKEKDKPVVQIQTPKDGEVIRNDFVISGMAFDDDGVESILYSLDGSEFVEVTKKANNFSIAIPLDSITNNDHLIAVKAIDILGIESDIVNSTFWVSKEEPVSNLLLPKIEETKKDTIKLVGTSFDKNGIDSVYVSTDNGVSYQKADGAEDWSYNFNTKNIKDGTYSIFVKSIDKLKTIGFYSTLINIDNTAPELKINEPYDGDILSDKIVFSGRSFDNIGLREVLYKIYSHSDETGEGIVVGEGELSKGGIFNIEIPLDGYSVGEYNIELIAYDNADNRSISTRNFTVTEPDNAGDLELLFPQAGSEHTSMFEVAGKVLGRKGVESVDLYIDETLFSNIKVNEFKYFNLNVDTFGLSEGSHTVWLKALLADGQVYETPRNEILVKNSGAWLNISNMKTGDNISGRPYLKGEAGFIQPKDTPEEEIITPKKVEVSLDNGQIFNEAKGASSWEFRIETWQFNDGLTPILVRCHYSNGDIKTSRIAVNIDRTKPEIEVIEDLEQGRFNESISLTGIASDSNGLTDISVILREGSKAEYEIPSLFQGMFIDLESGYGKVFGGGIGLTFFDDNVKVQFTAGQTRTSSDNARVKGIYYGGKLLANLYSLEFGALLGPDWDFFSMSLALGASFTQKTLVIGDEEADIWFSAIVGQMELAKIRLENTYLTSLSLYVDYEATLFSSESVGGFKHRIGLGTRLTLF